MPPPTLAALAPMNTTRRSRGGLLSLDRISYIGIIFVVKKSSEKYRIQEGVFVWKAKVNKVNGNS
jgi:chromosome condensin MukBEF MukE localization factor